ncbi:hypothetical protein DFH09DRAFT_1270577 [Mycena vulgaris]|nr:hypothetical protein DFH09DRAFT_1270577 [Mycena vulgaris]
MAVLDFNKRGKTVETRNRLRNAEPPLEEVLQRFSQAVPVLNLLLTNLTRLSSPDSPLPTRPLLSSPLSGYHLAMGSKPKRAAAVSQKAKDAASIAAEEAREMDEKPPPKKRGRPPKNKIVEAPTQELDELDATNTAAGAQAEEIDNVIIDWTTSLTETLITAIESDEDIRDGLFPGAGGIRLSSGKPKTHYYYKLAEICFADHPEYQEAFAVKPEYKAVQITQQRKLWTEKVKNKIKGLVTKTCENVTEMGETGAGITSADQVIPGTIFATKWDLMINESPWYLRMRTLIAARPNITPVGLGNNDTGFDTSLLIPSGLSHDNDDTSSGREDTGDLPDRLSEPEVVVLDDTSESDDDILAGPTLATAGKRKRGEDKPSRGTIPGKPAEKKTKPQPAISVPASR